MGEEEWEFTAPLWPYSEDAPDSWWFLSLPFEVTDEIEDVAGPRKGFGSVPVEVTIGRSTWRTSVFPDGRRKTFVLPVKKAVRRAEGLEDRTPCRVRLRLA